MNCRLGICTDSSSQLASAVASRYGIEIVPITLTADGVDSSQDWLDGVDVDADSYYERYVPAGRTLTASAPSPGQFALAYETLIERGCTEIVSVHGASPVAGVVQAARLAAHSTPATVRVVDTGASGASLACTVWALAEATQRGSCSAEAAALAEQFGDHIHRFDLHVDDIASDQLAPTVERLVADAISQGEGLRVAIGHSDMSALALADAIEIEVHRATSVVDVARYRIGPSAGE